MAEFPVDVLNAPQSGVDPGSAVDAGKLYSKSVLGVAQGHYQASDGTITQLTNAPLTDGSVPYSSLTNLLNLNTKTLLIQTAAQGIFDASIDAVTLAASTTYLIRAMIALKLTSITNCSTTAVFSGTATYTSFNGTISTLITQLLQYNITASADPVHVITSSANVQIAPIFGGATTREYFFEYNLLVVTNAGGTFLPSLQFGSVPNASSFIRLASMEIIPVGSNTFTAQNWT